MELARMHRPDVDRLDRSTIVLAPFAAMEQHALHLPFATDTLIADAICRRTDARLDGQLLVLPVVWLGNSPHHMDFAGTLTAEPQTFVDAAVQVVTSMAHHGFTKVLMLNAHGGNSSLMGMAVQEAQRRCPDAEIASVVYWQLIGDRIDAIRDSALGGMGHAGELETSVMLAIAPELVGPDRPVETTWARGSEYSLRDMFAFGPVTRYFQFSKYSKTGAMGDPTTATAEKGEAILDLIAERLADVCRHMRAGTL